MTWALQSEGVTQVLPVFGQFAGNGTLQVEFVLPIFVIEI